MRQDNEKPELTGTSASAKSAAMPAGDITLHWKWVARSVWTDRMLMALETGVKGSKWYSLMDKVWSPANLLSAWLGVKANDGAAGVDGQKAEQYLLESPQRLGQVQAMLKKGQYTPQPVKRVWIPKLGSKELRPLGVPAVEDRIVQTAVRNVIEPVFENLFAEHSYGFRPRRGAKDALRRVDQLLDTGKVWVVDADLKGYLDGASYYTPVHGVD